MDKAEHPHSAEFSLDTVKIFLNNLMLYKTGRKTQTRESLLTHSFFNLLTDLWSLLALSNPISPSLPDSFSSSRCTVTAVAYLG